MRRTHPARRIFPNKVAWGLRARSAMFAQQVRWILGLMLLLTLAGLAG